MLYTTDLKPGLHLRLADFGQTPIPYRRRLMALGLMKGSEVQLVRTAPFGCPLYLKLDNTILALRREEAKHLLWEQR